MSECVVVVPSWPRDAVCLKLGGVVVDLEKMKKRKRKSRFPFA